MVATTWVGIDIGASTVKLGLLGPDNQPIGERRDYPSRAKIGPSSTMAVIEEGVNHLLREHGLKRDDVAGIGASMPTPVTEDGRCIYATNIHPTWVDLNVRSAIATATELPVVLMNDGDAAAYREYLLRRAAGSASDAMAQFITGTGLGGSVILHGELLSAPGVVAELGHVITDTGPDVDRCGCGAMGCAETRASLTGLANLVRHRVPQDCDLLELQGDPLDVAKRLRRLGQADSVHPTVRAIWHEYFTHIGRAARSVANVLGCDLVVLSGGAQEHEDGASTEAWTRFLDEGLAWIREELATSFSHLRSLRVEWSIDPLPDSAAYGAAAYARHRAHRDAN